MSHRGGGKVNVIRRYAVDAALMGIFINFDSLIGLVIGGMTRVFGNDGTADRVDEGEKCVMAIRVVG
ncbi:hypothetical protein PEC302110_29740 [Pectobacterium araliae]|uniref:Uncharacterized protein n=1 Tax=Pectobacterium araliae TaxID=3073862 RepID=A0AAN0MM08_9GAMM|nr:hypothetical protein PEC302110_29740 [Pectobacterium sp. MAFF 302110]